MNLTELARNLATEDQCLDFIEKVRWHGKMRCPQCGGDKISRSQRKNPSKNRRTRFYTCLEPSCKQQFSPTSGTIFHDSHLPLNKWFFAVELLVDAKKGMSASQLARHLKVNYRTAWYLAHRIRGAMAGGSIVTGSTPLSGIVEVDETFIGGKHRSAQRRSSKAVVMGIRERGGDLRYSHIEDTTSESLAGPIKANISPDVQKVVTDEFTAYPSAMMQAGIHGSKHETIKHKERIYVRGDVHTNTIESAFSLFKRGIVGSFHQISRKHLHRYLSEFQYRFNGRDDADLFGATVANMVSTGGMKYSELTAN